MFILGTASYCFYLINSPLVLRAVFGTALNFVKTTYFRIYNDIASYYKTSNEIQAN